MRTPAFLILIATFAAGNTFAAPSADALFSKGNTAYVAGENAESADAAAAAYKEAADNYKVAIGAGDVSWAAYFNLGNASSKLGDYGEAVLAYERALVIDPVRPEAAVNMAKAREAAGLPAVRKPGRVEEWGTRIPMRGWMWAGAVSAWALLAAFVLPFLHGGHKLATICAVIASLALCAACAAGMYAWHIHAQWRIVTTDDAPMLAAPDDKASQVRKLGQATEVSQMRAYDKWIFVHTEQGDEGWMLSKDAASVWDK
jgi:tetratricopeptide (TPR) repeat protein